MIYSERMKLMQAVRLLVDAWWNGVAVRFGALGCRRRGARLGFVRAILI